MSFAREDMNVHNKLEAADILQLLLKKKKKKTTKNIQAQGKINEPHNTNLLLLNSNIHSTLEGHNYMETHKEKHPSGLHVQSPASQPWLWNEGH